MKMAGDKDHVYEGLKTIVGDAFVSRDIEELYMYSRDPGASIPRNADWVVLPNTTDDVRKIVVLARDMKIPVVPISGGLTLSGLAVPVKGGIVMDMRRMDRIVEVNEMSRYVVVESGVSQGKLLSFLKENYPMLRHSMPDAPPAASVVGNTLIYGSGHLSKHGAHSEMINGLEVVLGDGEILRLGSLAVSPYWFGRGPLPDLVSLFVNWFGTTGIVTRLSLKLYPAHPLRDMLIFLVQDPGTIPEAVSRITATDLMEDVLIVASRPPKSPSVISLLTVYLTAETPEELDFKKELFVDMFKDFGKEGSKIVFTPKEMLPQKLVHGFMEEPQYAAATADFKKGGGFEYVGVVLPLSMVPVAWKKGEDIAKKHGFDPLYTVRNVGLGHSVVFAFAYPFNRADEESLKRSRDALADTNDMALEIGGTPWKSELEGQARIMARMDPMVLSVMHGIKKVMDPEGIMNPGNWEHG